MGASTKAAAKPSGPPPLVDLTTVLSFLAVFVILILAYVASLQLLPKGSTKRTRVLFVWHSFDALVHLFFEGSFLASCFFVYTPLPSSFRDAKKLYQGPPPLILTAPDVFFLGREDRLYGARYGKNPFAKLWQEYAKADRRWGGADLGIISIELLTVGFGVPLCALVCELLRRGEKGGNAKWFWMTVLATGELYGGFMTFAPEWLSASPNLDTSNMMYLWVYLFFFNMLWVVFPIWVLIEAYRNIKEAMSKSEVVNLVNFLPMEKKYD